MAYNAMKRRCFMLNKDNMDDAYINKSKIYKKVGNPRKLSDFSSISHFVNEQLSLKDYRVLEPSEVQNYDRVSRFESRYNSRIFSKKSSVRRNSSIKSQLVKNNSIVKRNST